MPPTIHILFLGNDLPGDAAFGFYAAEELRRRFPQMDVIFTTKAGFHLIDYLSDVRFLVDVDTIQIGDAPPGTVSESLTSDIKSSPRPSSH